MWGVKKNVLSRDLKILMWNKMTLRKEEGKNTQFRYQKALVPEHKIRRAGSAYSDMVSVICQSLRPHLEVMLTRERLG